MAITFTTKKLKTALGEKTLAHKKELEHQVSLVAVAASQHQALLSNMKLEQRKLSELKQLPRRVRKSEKAQVLRVAKSLKAHRQSAPIVIADDGTIIHGHIVAQALRSLGAAEAWCIVIDHLSEPEREALNRIGEVGDWDLDLLGPLLVDLKIDGLDLTSIGFTIPELDILIGPAIGTPAVQEPEELSEPANGPPVSMLGDLWRFGEHLLLCGDSTKPESYGLVLNGRKADVVFTDIPWNLAAAFVSGAGKVKFKDFKMGAGEMSPDQFVEFCDVTHAHGANHLKPGGAFYSCIDWRSDHIVKAAGVKAGLRHINTIVWNKGSGGFGTPYRSAHELIVMFCKGDKLAVENVGLGKHGRDRTNVWNYPGANRRGSSAAKAAAHHPTPKPVEMVEEALKDVTNIGALVLDPFLGSGTTVLAAERAGRVAAAIEFDPAYVDVAIRRWEALTGKQVTHAGTGQTFAEIAIERAAAA